MKRKRKILIMFSIFAILLSGVSSLEASHSAPEAGFRCVGFGTGMSRSSANGFFDLHIKPTSANRKWTVQELFNNSIGFSSYKGEGKAKGLFVDKVDRGIDSGRVNQADWNASGVQERLEGSRSMFSCILGRLDVIPTAFMYLSTAILKITSVVINQAIGKEYIVDTIVDIVGGGGDASGGLIGTFTNSVYMPLVVIAFILTAATIIYKGLIQMKFREAIMSAVWSVLAFVIGLALMLSPQMLAGLPQTVTSTITTCVLGTLSGQNCITGEVMTPSLLAGKECRSEMIGGDENDIEVMINSMNCTIWKAFVMEPWAQQQFGEPYSQLYTRDAPPGAGIWSNLPEGEEDLYCVNLASTKSVNSSNKNNVVMDLDSDSTVCNVALYQLYLKTKMTDTINHSGDGYKLSKSGKTKFDARWYDIIIPMAKDKANWENWSGEGQFGGRLATGLMSLIASILSGIILFILSVFAASYKVIGVVMMAFAPLFLLLAIEPTRGRRMFLGWLESLVSTMLKYFATTVLMVIAIVMYAGVLASSPGLITSFLSVLILTAALWMYRKEIIDLIGASNMGGQRLSNKAGETIGKAGKQIKAKGGSYVGGRIGGAAAAKENRRHNIRNRRDTIKALEIKKENAQTKEEEMLIEKQIQLQQDGIEKEGSRRQAAKRGAKTGGAAAFNQAMARGTSATAAVFKQRNLTKRDLKKQNEKKEELRRARMKEIQDRLDEIERRRKDYLEGTQQENVDNSEINEDKKQKLKERLEGIRDQREDVDYTGDLSQEERKALDDFADKIANLTKDEELLNVASDEDTLKDPNKKALVNKEINARLKYNSLNGQISGPLSRHKFADMTNVSNEELKINLEMQRENYLETGSQEDFDILDKTFKESVARGTSSERELEAIIKQREQIEQEGVKYVRKEGVPTEQEFDKDPEKFLGGQEITPSEKLKELEEKRRGDGKDDKKGPRPDDKKGPRPDDKKGHENDDQEVEIIYWQDNWKKNVDEDDNKLPNPDDF